MERKKGVFVVVCLAYKERHKKKSLFKIRFRLKRTSGKKNKMSRHYLKKKISTFLQS